MNHQGYSFLRYGCFTLVLATVLVFSCRKQDMNTNGFLSLDKNSIRFDTLPGASENITVQSSVAWTAAIAPNAAPWLQLDKASGGPGNTVVKITNTRNNGNAALQTGLVTFRPVSGNAAPPVTLTVTQKPYGFTLGYSKTLGGASDESARMVSTPDGGIVIAGFTNSNDGDVHGAHGKEDAWIVKLNSTGDTVWTRTLGGTGDDVAAAIIVTADGGYMVAGSTESSDGDITDKRHGTSKDGWVIKLDGNGNISWSKTYGSSAFDALYSVVAAPDGGYLLAGVAGNNDGDITGYRSAGDAWALKLDNQGRLQWSKAYGGTSWDEAHKVIAVADGYVMAGLTNSTDGDVTGYHIPAFIGSDVLVVKIDLNGNKIWAKAYGGTNDDDATSLVATTGGYVVAAYTTSNDGDVTGIHGTSTLFTDMWALKLDEKGTIVWAKTYGGKFDEAATAIATTPDGGFILAGGASSNDGDVSGNHNKDGGTDDAWIVKLDAGGNKQWTKTLGGSGDDVAYSIVVNADGYTITGVTTVADGDVGGRFKGLYDIWAAKIIVQ